MGVPLNHSRVDSNAGDFVVLDDYGIEGMTVASQHEHLADAVEAFECGDRQVLVKLVRIPIPWLNDEGGV